MVTHDMTTPFAAEVVSARQSKKAKKGARVLVVCFYHHPEYGWSAISRVQGKAKDQFLSLKNLQRIGDASAEEVATLDAERKAWKDKGDAPVSVGTDPDWESDKAVAFDWTAESTRQGFARTGRPKRVRLFFPRSQWNAKAGTIPQWLWDKKVEQVQDEHGQGFRLTERWDRKFWVKPAKKSAA